MNFWPSRWRGGRKITSGLRPWPHIYGYFSKRILSPSVFKKKKNSVHTTFVLQNISIHTRMQKQLKTKFLKICTLEGVWKNLRFSDPKRHLRVDERPKRRQKCSFCKISVSVWTRPKTFTQSVIFWFCCHSFFSLVVGPVTHVHTSLMDTPGAPAGDFLYLLSTC